MRFTFAVLLTLICAVIALPVGLYAAVTADQALSLVEQSLLPEGKDQVILKIWGPISPGTEIRGTKELALSAPAAGYAIFIDDYPTANLFHPVRYAFVNAATGEVQAVHAFSPPLNYQDYKMVPTAVGDQLLAATNHRAPLGKGGAPPPTRGDRWAVLMNGGYDSGNNHVRYWNDLSNIYITLVSVYGYADDHIIVLCSDGLNPAPDQSNGQNSNPDLDGDGDADIMYSCVLVTVDGVFAWLADTVNIGDQLFIFTTDHGDTQGGWDTIENLWNHEELTDDHFAGLLAALPQCEIVCTLEPCFSGGFLDDVVVPPGPRVASSACAYNQYSYAMPPDYVYDTYVFHWTAAVKGEDAYGTAVNADYNGDGLITMDEAYRYAESHDQSAEDPQYGEEPVGVGAGISLWPTGGGPFLTVSETLIDDIGGNNNGAADPGETISLLVTLTNVGSGSASNIVGTLSTTDPYVTITQNSATYPDLGHFEQGQGTPAYMADISSACPQGHNAICTLHLQADSAYATDVTITIPIGNPLLEPVGPDAYGYYAYDYMDQMVTTVYGWIETAPDAGGSGTVLTWTNLDDQTQTINLPFTFRYYGQNYTQVSICTNGWLSMGATTLSDYNNTTIPNAGGPPAMVAAFWDDLHAGQGGTQICAYYDDVLHCSIVEWYNIAHYGAATTRETFEVILYDPAFWPTSTGDGYVVVLYKMVQNAASATFGIEDGTETMGIQYGFEGAYDPAAAPIVSLRPILYTTATTMPEVSISLTPAGLPIQIPASGGSFNYNVQVNNPGLTPQTFVGWCSVVLPNESFYGPVLGPVMVTLPAGVSINRNRTQAVPGSAPAGMYAYNAFAGIYPAIAWSSDSFPVEKLAAGGGNFVSSWENWGESFEQTGSLTAENPIPEKFGVYQVSPNPFNPVTTIFFALPEAAQVTLQVYDLSGRQVATLVEGWRPAGEHQVTFEGLNLASGLYFYRFEAGGYGASGKMVLMK